MIFSNIFIYHWIGLHWVSKLIRITHLRWYESNQNQMYFYLRHYFSLHRGRGWEMVFGWCIVRWRNPHFIRWNASVNNLLGIVWVWQVGLRNDAREVVCKVLFCHPLVTTHSLAFYGLYRQSIYTQSSVWKIYSCLCEKNDPRIDASQRCIYSSLKIAHSWKASMNNLCDLVYSVHTKYQWHGFSIILWHNHITYYK